MPTISLNDAVHDLLRAKVRETIAALLAGDVACFSTEQYADRYASLHWRHDEAFGRMLLGAALPNAETLARRHLRRSKLVREVRPDVWVAVTDL